jgi:hypothetical protein
MIRLSKVLVVAVLLAVASVPVSAQTESRYDQLIGPLGTVDLWSSATWTGTVWQYDYEMYNRPGNVGDVHVFIVDNPPPSPYSNATNDSGFPDDPVWPQHQILDWLNGNVPLGAYGHFHYKSLAAPDVVPVATLVINGGAGAEGVTLGMGAVIPEPGCLASLGGLLTMSAFCLRRARKR